MQKCQVCHKNQATITKADLSEICAECDARSENIVETKLTETQQTFRINGYEAEFVRFHLLKEEVIFFFIDLCRINHALQIGLIIRPTEILVDKEHIESFVDWCKELEIHFVNENFKFPKDNDWMQSATDIFSAKTDVVRAQRNLHNKKNQEKVEGEFIVRDLL